MKLSRSRRDEPEINLIPLIDILFFLLLFFMLSSTFDRAAELKIDLPKSAAQPQQSREENIEVVIDSAGNYFVNGTQIVNNQIDTLKRALQRTIGKREHPLLVISADGRTPHQAVVTAMDAARQVGLLHLSIATRTSAEDKR
jgi:biopolymer transport protein ExbD